ncbi:hypothetical protein BH10PAT1_BH10PAT1_1020 [soil metagenome]
MAKRILTNKNIAIRKCKHGYFMYYINDLFVGKSMDIYGEWTEDELQVLGNLIKPGQVVIDVGAFIGTHSVYFGQKVYPGGIVYSFEPQRTIFNLLCTNVAINNILNIKCINKAVGDENRTCIIPVLDPNVEQNFGGISTNSFKDGDFVETMLIDDMPLEGCHLIKIDVEGREINVLNGAAKTIKKFKPVLYVECNKAEKSEDILKFLKKNKYKSYWHILNYYSKNNYFKNKKNIFKDYQPEANLLCFPIDAKVTANGFIETKGITDTWIKALKRARINHS